MNDGEKSAGQQQPADGDVIPSRPQRFQPKLLEKTQHRGTDITSFRFTRSDKQQIIIWIIKQDSILLWISEQRKIQKDL